MNPRTARYLSFFLLAIPSAALANNKWSFRCNKGDCASCQSASCEPKVETYKTDTGFDTEAEAREAGEKECKGTVGNSYDGSSTGGTAQSTSAGVTTKNYSRSNLNFHDVSPDYVKTEDVNGVRTPKYLPVKQGGWYFNGQPDGFEIAKYPSSGLGQPDGNGIRPINPGAQPTSVTTYRNPDGGTSTSQGNLDVVHKQRHPQSGAWVTRCIRIHAPKNDNAWTTKFYLGDPKEDSLIEPYPYRQITITRTANSGGTETTHEITQDRDNSSVHGTLVTTSDITRTYAFYKHGEPVILSETRHTGTGSELTTTWTYNYNPADQGSFNKPATMRRSDGQWSNITYQGNPVTGTLVTKTVSVWLDNAAPAIGTAPDENANRVVIVFEAKNETGTIGREEKIQGVTVSKTWGERYKANSGEIVEKTNEQRGAATLTTIRTGYPDNDSATAAERGRLKSVQRPDGTVTLHRHAMQGENRVETIDTGVGSLSAVTDGTRTISTYTKDDVLIAEVTRDIASDIELSAKQAIAFDANDQPSRWAYDNNLDDYSETLNGCCGIDSTRTRDGVVTSYTRVGLKRPKTAVSHGITLSYKYGSTPLEAYPGITFPTTKVTQSSGSLSLDQGTTVYDFAGNVIQQIRPDLNGDGAPEITSSTRNHATHTTTTHNPDGGEIVQTDYADGQSKSTTGNAVPDSSQVIAVGSNLDGIAGAVLKSTTTRPSGTAAGDQITTTYQAIGGLTLATKLNDITTATYGYDNLARSILVTDGDGVKQHTAYNAKGEAYRRATSRDGDDTIDLGTDTVRDTLTDVSTIEGFGPAIRTRHLVWLTATESRALGTTLQSPDGTKSSATATGFLNPTIGLSASAVDRADGAWTDTQTNPDGTKQVTVYSNWLSVSSSSLNTENLPLETSSIGYDALRRPETTTHSRTGVVTTHYDANGQVSSIHDHGRITGFKYDKMGNLVETTLPDGSTTFTVYSVSGQSIISWGSQTYPTYNTYDEQGRQLTLRTNPTLTTAGVPTNAGGSLTTWFYCPNGQLQQKLDAADKGAIYTYTNAGRLHTRTWARGVVTTYNYTTSGLLHTVIYSNEPSGQTTPNLEYTYDILNRQDTVKRGGILHADYDYRADTLALDKEKLQIDTLNQTLTRTYESGVNGTLAGRPNGYTFPGGSATWTYNNTGRLATVTDGSDTFTYGYLAHSNLIETVTKSGTPVFSVTNEYEPTRDVLLSKTNSTGGPQHVSKFTYAVNNIGQRETVATTGTAFGAAPANWTWGYDSLGQVTSADSPTPANDRGYLFDSIGNRRGIRAGAVGVPTEPNGTITDGQGTLTYASNSLNQYTTVPQSTAAPTFDFDGNMLTGPVPGPAGSSVGIPVPANAELTWDAENRLIKAVVGGTTINYAYDQLSRLISRSVGISPTSATHYLYDGWNRIAEYSGTTLEKTYLWGMDLSGTKQGAGGVGGLLSLTINNQPSTPNFFPTFDGNGNVSEYLASNGSITTHFEYDPFGNTVVSTDTNRLFAYRFSTKPQDFSTGLYYYGYRWYDTITGRWSSRDPIGEQDEINLYEFLGNNATLGTDYLGNAYTDQGVELVKSIMRGFTAGFTQAWMALVTRCACSREDNKWHTHLLAFKVYTRVIVRTHMAAQKSGSKVGSDLLHLKRSISSIASTIQHEKLHAAGYKQHHDTVEPQILSDFSWDKVFDTCMECQDYRLEQVKIHEQNWNSHHSINSAHELPAFKGYTTGDPGVLLSDIPNGYVRWGSDLYGSEALHGIGYFRKFDDCK